MADTGWISAGYSLSGNQSTTYAGGDDWAGDNEPWRSAVRFDEADFSLPGSYTITQVDFRLYPIDNKGDLSAKTWAVHPYDSDGQTDPEGDTAAQLHSRSAGGTAVKTGITSWRTMSQYGEETLDSAANSIVENAFSAGSFVAFGVKGESDPWNNSQRCEYEAYDGTNKPQMKITYTTTSQMVGFYYTTLMGA